VGAIRFASEGLWRRTSSQGIVASYVVFHFRHSTASVTTAILHIAVSEIRYAGTVLFQDARDATANMNHIYPEGGRLQETHMWAKRQQQYCVSPFCVLYAST
jgi:hypothetical protein